MYFFEKARVHLKLSLPLPHFGCSASRMPAENPESSRRPVRYISGTTRNAISTKQRSEEFGVISGDPASIGKN